MVVAAQDYPASGDTGSPIVGLDEARELGALVFHAGTAARDHTLVTSGGRILGVTGVGPDIAAARELAYSAVERISFPVRGIVATSVAETPLVGILIGSESDRERMQPAGRRPGARHSLELEVLSAHRQPTRSRSTRRRPASEG